MLNTSTHFFGSASWTRHRTCSSAVGSRSLSEGREETTWLGRPESVWRMQTKSTSWTRGFGHSGSAYENCALGPFRSGS